MNDEKREMTQSELDAAYARQEPGSGEKHDKHASKDVPEAVPATLLSDWTVKKLKEFADDNEIDLNDATKKADIVAAIEEWEEK